MSANTANDYDIVIIGAGLVGSALALGLNQNHPGRYKIAVVEKVQHKLDGQPGFDDRNLALSESSRRILQQLGFWSDLQKEISFIRSIHVSEQNRPAVVRMHASDIRQEALGYVISARALGETLLGNLTQTTAIDFYCPATVSEIRQGNENVTIQLDESRESLNSRLLVLAEGTDSSHRQQLGFQVSEKDYGQTAIVANLETELAHQQTAYERFSSQGPLALLPKHEHQMGLVFTVANQNLEQYLAQSDDAFINSVQIRFGRRLGRITRLGTRKSYPLRYLEVEQQSLGRCLLLGNAAHTMHPNMAQGFNLALRDVAGLLSILLTQDRQSNDPGAESIHQAYAEQRQPDQKRIMSMTDRLGNIFYNEDIFKSCWRNLALQFMDVSPWLKRRLMLTASGLLDQRSDWTQL